MKVANYNFSTDLSKVILWQYTDAEKFNAIVNNEQQFMDENVTQFWEDFNHNIFNLSTCNTFGLELWGKLLGVARPTYLDGGVQVEYDDEQYRLVLRARIYLLTFDGSARALNEFFKMLLPDYQVAITDNLDMTVDINFVNEPTAEIKTVLNDSLFLPRPSGVKYNINWNVDYGKTFGFEGMTHKENGVDKEPPAFTDADSGNYDPETDGGGTWLK